jgi:nanoRNase/pAp phosphatase (c-di-AMP/oligoRNAs hydrolase)
MLSNSLSNFECIFPVAHIFNSIRDKKAAYRLTKSLLIIYIINVFGMILLLGCDAACREIAAKLKNEDRDFVVIEEGKKAQELRESGFSVCEGSPVSSTTLKKAGIKDCMIAIILGTDTQKNARILKAVKKLRPQLSVVVMAPGEGGKKLDVGDRDALINQERVVAAEAMRRIYEIETRLKFQKLMEIIKRADNGIAIVTQNNPDPDAIASALSLKRIIEEQGAKAEIVYGDEIGHDENKAMINLLGIKMKPASRVNIRSYSIIALVESSIPGINNPLTRDITPDIIIDHHPVDMRKVKGEYVDIRPEVGATSTLLTQYLLYMGIEIDGDLATALLYGIKSDTNDFTRGATPEDLEAVMFLYPRARRDVLARIESPLISAEAFDVLAEAIKNRKVRGSCLLSNVGFIRDRETLPQAAEYLLNLEGVATALIYGVANEVIHISGRNRDVRINLGDVMQKAFGDIGQAGGHAHAAAAKISLGLFGSVKDKETLLKLAEEAVADRFLKILGVEKPDKS